jgi:outer membrane protein assembly factor BamD (BamD/ComL family)
VEDHTSVVDPGVAPIPSSHPETAVVPPPTVTPPPGADASVDDGPYARARALEAKREFGAAAREYERASVEDPAHADLATYRLGRLAQKNLHDPVRARAAFTRYRERFPNGALLPEVDFAMLELEVETHSDTAALADASRFLAAHPTSERADEVRLLRGNLRRDQSQCSEAIGDYAMVSSAPFTDHAVYSTAYCQRKLGDRQGAAATLRGYLARFPNGAHRAEAEKALSDD